MTNVLVLRLKHHVILFHNAANNPISILATLTGGVMIAMGII